MRSQIPKAHDSRAGAGEVAQVLQHAPQVVDIITRSLRVKSIGNPSETRSATQQPYPTRAGARPRAWLQGQARGFSSALEITTDLLRVGAGPGCELCLADPNALAEHAVVRYVNGRYYLQDLGSPTGTHVNGQRVSVITLQDGALITIGRTLLRFWQQP